MKTTHSVCFADARKLRSVDERSIDLVVTSPPYPMIEMWDETFAGQSRKVRSALERADGDGAFEAMHQVLDPVWAEVARVLKPGGLACINIGDATRKIGDRFMLYPNHARLLSVLYQKGLSPLPAIIWRKQTNAPNKFMGSGMLPAGAYVTLEHEYVLILRKGDKRGFDTPDEKAARRRSAIFWEERNVWFSDVWMELKGTRQKMPKKAQMPEKHMPAKQMPDKQVRERSGAFPFELPYRLINMYSVAGDTVLDPFLGAGTSLLAAMAAGRNSIGFELEAEFAQTIRDHAGQAKETANQVISDRLERHAAFVKERLAAGKAVKHSSRAYGFPVVTRQETEIYLARPVNVRSDEAGRFTVTYADAPPGTDLYAGSSERAAAAETLSPAKGRAGGASGQNPKQQDLF